MQEGLHSLFLQRWWQRKAAADHFGSSMAPEAKREKRLDHFGSSMATGEGRERQEERSLWIRITLDSRGGRPRREKEKKIVEEKGRKMREDKDTQSPTTMAVVLSKQRQKDGEQERDQPMRRITAAHSGEEM